MSVNESFNMIQTDFRETDSNISDEDNRIEHIAGLFSRINAKVDSIADISGEQAASTEDPLATLKGQTANLESRYSLLQEIKYSSDDLQAVIE